MTADLITMKQDNNMYSIKPLIISFAFVLLSLAMTEYAYFSKSQIVEGEGDQLEIGFESDNYKGVLFNFSCEGIKKTKMHY